MSDRAELDALRRLAELEARAETKPPSRREIYEDVVRTRGWGTGFGPAVHEIGGKVTDVTRSPLAGAATNFLLNALPAFLTSGRVEGAPVTSLVDAPAKRFMQSAFKPSTATYSKEQIKAGMKTALDENIYPTPGGMDKAGRIVNKLDDLVDAEVAKSGERVAVSAIMDRLKGPLKRAETQFVPQSDVAAVEDVWTKGMQNPLLAGRADIPVQLAHELKKGTYAALGKKAYGELGSSSVEAQKALARGAREEVAEAVPSVVDLLKRESALMNLREMGMARAMQQGNANPFGLAALRMDHIPSAALTMADRIAAIKAFLAMQAYHGTKPHILAPAGVTAGILEDRGILYP